jgi:hypothetical protein
MTVRELMQKLSKFDPDADAKVVDVWPYFRHVTEVYVPDRHITGPCVAISSGE